MAENPLADLRNALAELLVQGWLYLGQDVRHFGGAHHQAEGLHRSFPDTVVQCGVWEQAMGYAAAGAALAGKSVIVEAQYTDFLAPMLDGLWNELVGWTRVDLKLNPQVIVLSFIGPPEGGIQHSKYPAWVHAIPGAVVHSTRPALAGGALRAAAAETRRPEVTMGVVLVALDSEERRDPSAYLARFSSILAEVEQTVYTKDKDYDHMVMEEPVELAAFDLLRRLHRLCALLLQDKRPSDEPITKTLADLTAYSALIQAKLEMGYTGDRADPKLRRLLAAFERALREEPTDG